MYKQPRLLSFAGRICRLQFWVTFYGLFFLFAFLAFPLAGLVNTNPSPSVGGIDIFSVMMFFVSVLFVVIITAAIAKRFHDRDKSGLWALISLTGVGFLWIIIECGFMKGTVGPNKY